MSATAPECPKRFLRLVSSNTEKQVKENREDILMDKVADSKKIDSTASLEIFRLVQGLSEESTFHIILNPNVSMMDFMRQTQGLEIIENFRSHKDLLLMTINPSQIASLIKISELSTVRFIELHLRSY